MPPDELAFTPALRQRITAHLAAAQPARFPAEGLRHAAVGVVLIPERAGQACFVLTRRVATLRRHAGQWALPGGRLEDGESPEAAALREIREEIHLDLPADSVLGRLDDFVTRSGHLVSPYVAWSPTEAELEANPDEVAAVFRVPLEDLDRPDSLRTQPLLHFALNSVATSVYAPTAAILFQFRELALHGRQVRIGHVEQPSFAWR